MSAPDLMAIVSKAVWEKQAKGATPGTVAPLDRYNSENKALEPLAQGGRLFLFTVRPEGERLWLVAVLERLTHSGGAWVAAEPNRVPITDISELRSKIVFESGKGITAKPGSLGMSLQTPRALAASDVTLLLGAAGAGGAGQGAQAGGDGAAAPDERTRLLQAVLAAPESVEPRLVYADWLQEQGDPRGELISVQCLLGGGLEYPSQRHALRAREQELLAEHGELWSAPAKKLSHQHWFRRGFIDEVHAGAGTFLPGAAALFAVEPVLRLVLEEMSRRDCASLAGAPWLGRVRRLKLRGEIGDAGMAALGKSLQLGALASLNLGSCELGPKGAGALAEASMRACRSLSLSGNPIRDAGLRALVRSPLLEGCRRLYLARCGLSSKSVVELAGSERVRSLTGLCLGGNAIDDPGLQALADSPHLSGLKRLELDEAEGEGLERLQQRFGKALRLTYGGGGDYGDFDDDDGDDGDE